MGSSCHFPATPLGMVHQHGFCAVQGSKHRKHTTSIQHQTLGPHQSLIQIVLADASCNIALTVLMALSLAQPFRSSSSALYIQVKWPQNTITISTQSSPHLQFPAKKERSNHDQHQEDRSAGQEVVEDGSAWEEAPHGSSKGSRQVLHFRDKQGPLRSVHG